MGREAVGEGGPAPSPLGLAEGPGQLRLQVLWSLWVSGRLESWARAHISEVTATWLPRSRPDSGGASTLFWCAGTWVHSSSFSVLCAIGHLGKNTSPVRLLHGPRGQAPQLARVGCGLRRGLGPSSTPSPQSPWQSKIPLTTLKHSEGRQHLSPLRTTPLSCPFSTLVLEQYKHQLTKVVERTEPLSLMIISYWKRQERVTVTRPISSHLGIKNMQLITKDKWNQTFPCNVIRNKGVKKIFNRLEEYSRKDRQSSLHDPPRMIRPCPYLTNSCLIKNPQVTLPKSCLN